MRTILVALATLSFLCVCLAVSSSPHTADRSPPSGDIYVHDPSSSAYDQNSRLWYAFSTALTRGVFIATHVSTHGYAWKPSDIVFSSAPDWIHTKVPGNGGGMWAPDIIYLNGFWHLYYAASTFGSQTSCIGLATTPALDPNDPNHLWTDQGAVICSDSTAPYNTIDPHVFVNPTNNQTWMNFGSFWNGIYVVQLTGYPIVRSPVGTPVNVAKSSVTGEDPIEASWVQPDPRGAAGGFWLFANWGFCCRGVNSTYNVRVGRSDNPSGPYIDASGVDMIKAGGTLLIGTDGRQIGPGQIGFPNLGPLGSPGGNLSAPIVTYHYYDAKGTPPGQHTLGQAVIEWINGWPVATVRE